MTSIEFEDTKIILHKNESVLDGLIRSGHDVPNGCHAGVCQSCIMASDDATDISAAQGGLSDIQKELNYFLSCQCKPSTSIRVRRAKPLDKRVRGIVIGKSMIGKNIISLRIKAPLDYRPGQYVTLWKDDSLARTYSLASHPYYNDSLEFHIKYIRGGKFSTWVWDTLRVGDGIDIRGPMGMCVYAGDNDQPLLMAALGTGLAPIYGILQDALVKQHKASIDVVIAAKSSEDFYLVDKMLELQQRNDQVRVKFLSQEESVGFAEHANVYDYCKETFADLKNYRVYICGAESFVRKLRKQCFMSGASMQDIAADIFLAFGR